MIGKPCAQCYRARNYIKDGLGRLIPRQSTHVLYTTSHGKVRVLLDTNVVDKADVTGWVGKEVYAGGGVLIDIETQTKLATIYRWQRVKVLLVID